MAITMPVVADGSKSLPPSLREPCLLLMLLMRLQCLSALIHWYNQYLWTLWGHSWQLQDIITTF